MDDETAKTLACAAGLQRAWTQHRADVLEALATLEHHRRNLPRLREQGCEPLPARVPRP